MHACICYLTFCGNGAEAVRQSLGEPLPILTMLARAQKHYLRNCAPAASRELTLPPHLVLDYSRSSHSLYTEGRPSMIRRTIPTTRMSNVQMWVR